MKKNHETGSGVIPLLKKIVLIMKLTVIGILIFTMQVTASVYSQNTKLSLSLKASSLKEVLSEIESKTDFRFIVQNERLNLDEKIDIKVENKSVEDILHSLFKERNINYLITDNNLIIVNPVRKEKENININEAGQQVGSVKGNVTDVGGEPLPGVSVVVKGTTVGITTDFDGNYSLDIPAGSDVLVFSFVGMKTQEIALNGQSTINVVLKEDAIGLDEVVAVGYGSMKKSDLTGSVASVSSDKLTTFPASSATEVIQGRAAGVHVASSNNVPGQAPRIRVRGATSINASSDPLFVVDGFAGGSLPAPEDIESIEVLKDASGTAIYGSRGANGVILVTTKSGKKGKTKVEVNVTHSMQGVANMIDVMNAREFAEYMNDVYINDGKADIIPYPNAASLGEGTDYMDLLTQTGNLTNIQASVAGGKDKLSYYVSGKVFDQEGVVINTGYKSYSLTANLDMEVNEKLDLGFSLQMGHEKTYNPGALAGLIAWSLKFPPTQSLYDENGEYPLSEAGDPINSGVAIARERKSEKRDDDMQAIFKAHYKITEDLQFVLNAGAKIENSQNGTYIPKTLVDGEEAGGIATLSSSRNINLIDENYFIYDKSLGSDHSISLMAGYSYQNNENSRFTSANKNFITDSGLYWAMGSGSNVQIPSSSLVDWTMESFYGRANYRYKGKYMITFTGRYDGSSRFGENNKWAFFPSGAFAWNVMEEDFMQDFEKVSQLKARVSYGKTGNTDIGSYQSLANFTPILSVQHGEIVNGVAPLRVANNNLTWESTGQFDIGVDLGLFNNRLRFTADYYRKKTTDLLYDVPLPEYSGYASMLQNIGAVENKGMEFTVGSDNMTGQFKWNTEFNISFNKNKILELYGGDLIYNNIPSRLVANDSNILREGEVVGAFYGWIFDGIYGTDDDISAEPGKVPGDVRFRDINGRDANGELTGEPDGVVNNDDRKIIGNPHPDFIFGLHNDFSYKNFDLNIFFSGSYGNDILNFTNMEMEWMNGKGNQRTTALDRWTPTNQDTNVPRASGSNKAATSTRFVEDGSFIRLKNVTLGYTLPKSVLKKINVEKIRFSISAQNLFTLTDYSGFDPEVSNHGGSNSNINVGMDYGAFPSTRSVTLGCNIVF